MMALLIAAATQRYAVSMSKLSDAMRRALRREARPIGFAASATRPIPTMLLLARVQGAAEAGEAAAQGADAVITTSAGHLPRGTDAAIWGTEALVEGRAGARALREAGADFLVFADDATDASVLLEEDLGFIMRISLDAEDTFLRTVESLPLDALLVPGLEGALTVRRTLDLRRLTAFARKPLILPVTPAIDGTALEALRDCGVIGAVVEGAAGAAALRPKIDALAPRRRPKDGRSVSVLPGGAVAVTHVDEPDEPDEE